MNRLLTTLAALALCLLPTSSASAQSAEAGEHDAGWMRVVCEGSDTYQRCHLRVPDGFTEMRTRYVHGGDVMAVEDTYPYRPHGVTKGRSFNRRITTGVRVLCSAKAGRVKCEVRFRERIDGFAVTTWSASSNYGGVRWNRWGV